MRMSTFLPPPRAAMGAFDRLLVVAAVSLILCEGHAMAQSGFKTVCDMPELAPRYPQCRGAAPAPDVPTGPTQEQLDKQDREEAASDANDKGARAYERGDYDEAIRRFQEARDLNPDEPAYAANLTKARATAADAKGHAALASKPPGVATGELETLGGKKIAPPNPTITVVPLDKRGDPVLTPAQRKAHPAVAEMEETRAIYRKDIAAVEAEIKNPKTDPALIPALKIQVSDKKKAVASINMSIKFEVIGPNAK